MLRIERPGFQSARSSFFEELSPFSSRENEASRAPTCREPGEHRLPAEPNRNTQNRYRSGDAFARRTRVSQQRRTPGKEGVRTLIGVSRPASRAAPAYPGRVGGAGPRPPRRFRGSRRSGKESSASRSDGRSSRPDAPEPDPVSGPALGPLALGRTGAVSRPDPSPTGLPLPTPMRRRPLVLDGTKRRDETMEHNDRT